MDNRYYRTRYIASFCISAIFIALMGLVVIKAIYVGKHQERFLFRCEATDMYILTPGAPGLTQVYKCPKQEGLRHGNSNGN